MLRRGDPSTEVAISGRWARSPVAGGDDVMCTSHIMTSHIVMICGDFDSSRVSFRSVIDLPVTNRVDSCCLNTRMVCRRHPEMFRRHC
jgi:hypothetical protein